MRNNNIAAGRTLTATSATPQTVRDLNLSVIINLIRRNHPISRAELADKTGIHRSNVGIIIDELHRSGLLHEERARNSGRGRTPTLISMGRGPLRVLAINMRHERTTLSLASLDGHIEATHSFETCKTTAEFISKVKLTFANMTCNADKKSNTPARIAQVVVSIPGIVEVNNGKHERVWTPGLPQLSGTALRALLENALGIPCHLANNAGLGAIAALRLTKEDLNDFVFIVIGDVGVGSGVVLHRSLYTGHDAAFAGEIGHSTINHHGPQCSCGRHGCLQSYICDAATWARYSKKTPFSSAKFEEFLKEVTSGSPRARKALSETVAYLAVGVSNVAMMLNPEKILIAGALTKVWPEVKEGLVSQSLPPHHHSMIQPVQASLDTLFLRGAIEVGVDLVLKDRLDRRGGRAD